MLDLTSLPLVDHHSHAGLYERRLGRWQTLTDLEGPDRHYTTSGYRALLRQACADLYGEPSNWAQCVSAQYADGVEAAYTRMLQRLGIQQTLWDYRRLSRAGWPEPQYRLIYWIDPFICPFVDASFWRPAELEGALREALALSHMDALPPTLEEYLAFVESTLQAARPGLAGLKLALGYQRSLAFEPVPFEEARRAYARLRTGDHIQHRPFQDFMGRRLFQLAGELDLPLQIHASFGGPGSGLQLSNNHPALLERLLTDPTNRATRVVLLHGGYPYISEACALTWAHQQVSLDFSVLPTLFTSSLARWLEEWLELLPGNRLLFGTDASSPEEYYMAATNGRRQLTAALEALVRAGTLSARDAVALAERVGYQNAVELYGLSK